MESMSLPINLGGVVKRYKGNGRALGYPTANIDPQTDLPDGIYFCFSGLGVYKNHPSLIFIGTPTTVGDTKRRVEAYLLDIPDVDYYGQTLDLDIIYFHRANQTFKNITELQEAMNQDEITARNWFEQNESSL
jgi:riboflavin kinase/FMN adenylyltransferase